MKKEQFRSMVKEIIKEVISEMHTPTEQTATEATTNEADLSKLSPDDKINRRSAAKSYVQQKDADKKWGDKQAKLQAIKKEPSFQQAKHGLDAVNRGNREV
jgi:hypothetical protein